MIQTLFGSLEEQQKPSFLDRMKEAVSRTRENLAERIEDAVSFNKEIDRNTLDDLEATLIGADLGTTTTHEVLEKLREKADRKQIKDVDELKRLLKEELLAILTAANSQPVQKVDGTPEVILVVGVNGTGKTTTIGKLAQVFRSQGKNVLMCAADTFRAAAIEQLEIWGQRTGTEVIKTKAGGDPAAVLFDALQAATARKTDYVVVDTAGRLHTKTNLMAELEKMRRTAQRIVPGAPHETLLVMDATTGQNGLQQARLFTEDQARWHRQGRSGGGDLGRVGCPRAVCGSRREGRRSAPVRSEGIRGFAVRLRFLQVCQNPILVQCRPSGTWSVSSIGPRLTPGGPGPISAAASRLGPIVFEGTDCVERIAPFLPRDFACLIITLTKSFCARRWNWRVAALGSLPPTRMSELSSSPKTAKWWAPASTPTRA